MERELQGVEEQGANQLNEDEAIIIDEALRRGRRWRLSREQSERIKSEQTFLFLWLSSMTFQS